MTHEKIGFIGLGLMGSAMAGRLLDQGFPLVVYNRTASKAGALLARGAERADSPAAVAREADRIGLMVLDGRAVHALLDGAEGLSRGLGAGKLVVNFSTVGTAAALELNAAVLSTGAMYLDAPVLGSIEPAASGQLILFAGGSKDALERGKTLLEAVSRRIFHTGEAGSASAVKLVANMLLARYVETLGEVLSLCRGFSLDPALMLEVMQTGALASPMWEKARVLASGSPPLHFPLRHMIKDLNLLDEEIERLGISLPAQEAVHETFVEALQSGMGDRDYSEVVRFLLGRV